MFTIRFSAAEAAFKKQFSDGLLEHLKGRSLLKASGDETEFTFSGQNGARELLFVKSGLPPPDATELDLLSFWCSVFGMSRRIFIDPDEFGSILLRAENAGFSAGARRSHMSRINVLSIDGGGIRGIIPATILAAIEEGLGRQLHEVFDLIAGTSTGGIIALGIGTAADAGKPYRPADLLGLYVENGPAIFKKDLLTPIKSFFGPKYSPDALERTLEKFFGDTELRSGVAPLLISSYDLATQLPFFFKSHRIAADPTYNWKVRQIARATSAAPTFFPPFKLQGGGKDHALVDGGIFVNNPGMAAYAEARNLYRDASEFLIVSVGTGDRDDRITYSTAKGWGLIGWARQIIPVMMDSVSEAVDYELDAVLGRAATRQHFRLQPRLTIASNEMDDTTPQNLENLKLEAEEFLRKNAPMIQTICAELRPGRGSDMPGVGRPAKNKSSAQIAARGI